MKSFFKIASLFALIVAGRYMQLATPAATTGLAKTPVALFAADSAATLTLARYVNRWPAQAVPVSQQQANQPMTWF
ncbi:MAG: hypothetical protein ACRYG7_25585 [Janthinobacterium lividum]